MRLYRLVPVSLLLLTAGCSAPLFDLAKWHRKETAPFADTIRALAFSPDGEYLASCHEYEARPKVLSNLPYTPRAVKVWHRASSAGRYSQLAAFPIEDNPMGPDGLRFSADGKQLAILTERGLWFWNVDKRVLHESVVSSAMTMSYDARMAAKSVNRDGTPTADLDDGNSVAIVETSTDQPLQTLPCDGCEGACPRCFSPDGELILIAVAEKKMHPGMLASPAMLEIWNVRDGTRQCRVATDGRQAWQWRFSPDGKRLALMISDHGNGTQELYDTATGKRQAVVMNNASNFHSQTFSPDGRLLAVGGNISKKRDDPYSALLVWDVQKAEEDPMSFLFGLPSGMLGMSDGDIYALAFSPDNKFLAAGDNTGHIWFCSRHRVDEDENTFFNWEITDPMSAN